MSGEEFVVPRDPAPARAYLHWRKQPHLIAPRGSQRVVQECFFARNAIYHGMSVLGITPAHRVLVPAYICRAAIDPILALGIACDFYAVHADGRPDFEQLRAAIRPETRAVLVVHYFGFPQPIRELRALCDQHGLALIEDCAHVLRGSVAGAELGSFGDISMFSWRKFLPIADGALLWINPPRCAPAVAWEGHPPLRELKVAYRQIEAVANRKHDPPWWRLLLRPMQNRTARRVSAAESSTTPELDSTSMEFDERAVNWRMTGPSRALLERSDLGRIMAARRKNYEFLARSLSAVRAVELLHPVLDSAVCPWVLPTFIKGVERPHLPLRARGIPAVTWEGVRPGNWQTAQFPSADALYENLVMLPVHQGLTAADLETIAAQVRAIAGS